MGLPLSGSSTYFNLLTPEVFDLYEWNEDPPQHFFIQICFEDVSEGGLKKLFIVVFDGGARTRIEL
jgi:hypothetical protein